MRIIKKIAVFISGRGTNLQALIDAETKNNLAGKISMVLSNKKDAYGLKRAEKHNVPTIIIDHTKYKSREEHEKKIIEVLQQYSIDIIVLAGYMRIITDYLIGSFSNKIINIHPALLPSFPGLNAQLQALEYGVKITGCTTHFVDSSIDGGPILLQKSVEVKDNDNEEILTQRILKVEHSLLVQTVNIVCKNNYEIIGKLVKIKEQLT